MKCELILGLFFGFVAGLHSATAADVFGAIRTGDIAAVRDWAQSASDVEIRDRDGNTGATGHALFALQQAAGIGIARSQLRSGVEFLLFSALQ